MFSSRYARNSRGYVDSFSVVFVLFGVLVVLGIIGGVIYSISQVTTQGSSSNCHVINKDRTSNSDGDSDMRVYTDNCGTFRVTDTIVGRTNFNSADLFSSIAVGHTYNFTTRGYRVGILSDFPLILTADEVK